MKQYHLAVTAMVLHDKEVLLVKSPLRGWEFPGGFVDEGETIEEAVKREVKEEAGVDIYDVGLCGLERFIEREHIVFLFRANVTSKKLTIGEEVLDAQFFSIEDAMKRVAFKHYEKRLKKCLETTQSSYLGEYS